MDANAILGLFKRAVREQQIEISLHAAEEALAEHTTRPEIEEAMLNALLVEDYPKWWLGPSCPICGQTAAGRDLHAVLSYSGLPVTIITVYEPQPPKWVTPTLRGGKEP